MTTGEEPWRRLRRYWDRHARTYDRQMGLMERALLGGHRGWACSQAAGNILEVAIGTGLNLPYYPADAHVTGIDWSPAMLGRAAPRARELDRTVDLHKGDAQALEFGDAVFDTVVCTYSLCGIPDDWRAIAEMHRVLRPGGRLVLVDHVAAGPRPVRAVQRLLEVATVPLWRASPAPPGRPGASRGLRHRPPGTVQARDRRAGHGSQGAAEPAGWLRRRWRRGTRGRCHLVVPAVETRPPVEPLVSADSACR